MSKKQTASFICDRPQCGVESPVAENFTAARKAAVKQGWMVHPASGENQKHVCPSCVSTMLAGTDAQ